MNKRTFHKLFTYESVTSVDELMFVFKNATLLKDFSMSFHRNCKVETIVVDLKTGKLSLVKDTEPTVFDGELNFFVFEVNYDNNKAGK